MRMPSAWSRAAELAAKTPATRNRYVDFLRALSILSVVFGHWLAAAPFVDADGQLTPTHLLIIAPWSHWLSWFLQVMPIFFMVGGFSNGLTWRAARRDGAGYAAWLGGRLRRLVWPVLPLLIAWIALGLAAPAGGVRPEMVRITSQFALIPTWFLAVYVGVVALVPLSHAAWSRFGWASFWAFVIAAVAMDWAWFGGWTALGWLNYLFVWLAVHQLGYAWSEGRLELPRTRLALFVGGLSSLFLLTAQLYPRAMVSVPGEEFSNTAPPKITLIALACAQGGLAMLLQGPARRWLSRARPWTATVLINGMIMTIYLWHLTALVLATGLLVALDGWGLRVDPGSAAWWRVRPLWMAGLVVALVPLVAIFRRLERPAEREGPPPAAWRLVAGAAAVCVGLALLALNGIGGHGPLDWFGLNPLVLALPFAGALLIGVRPRAASRSGVSGSP